MAITPKMEEVVQYLAATQKAIEEAATSGGNRPWTNYFGNGLSVKAGKFEFDKIHDIFDRKEANDEYARLRSEGNTKSKDLQTAKLSADFLAGCERDYRMRTRSRIRTLVHGGIVSPRTFGDSKGPLRANTIDWLGRILEETAEEV